MTDVVLHPLAEKDFAEAFCWYAKRSERAAAQFDVEVAAAIGRIAGDPQRFSRLDSRHQFCLIERYPYVLIFRTRESDVVVVAIAHGRRRAYWKRRSTS